MRTWTVSHIRSALFQGYFVSWAPPVPALCSLSRTAGTRTSRHLPRLVPLVPPLRELQHGGRRPLHRPRKSSNPAHPRLPCNCLPPSNIGKIRCHSPVYIGRGRFCLLSPVSDILRCCVGLFGCLPGRFRICIFGYQLQRLSSLFQPSDCID